MDFYIQMGHGMQTMSVELIKNWGEGTVILSPVNIKPNRISAFSKQILLNGGQVLLDPQMYYPEKYHKNLKEYNYWLLKDSSERLIEEICLLNIELETSKIILPSYTINEFSEDWVQFQKNNVKYAKKSGVKKPLYLTVALGKELMKDTLDLEKIVLFIEKMDIEGVYLVCEHPDKMYLVEEPLWILNLMNLVTSIKRSSKKAIVGYASHQMLFLASTKCDAIASGNFLNVRWFQSSRFESVEERNPSRRSTWYYSPTVFSEFKLAFLDLAFQMGYLDVLKPPFLMESLNSEMLFLGELPSSSGFTEKNSHRHYLHCLYYQCKLANKSSYTETFNSLNLQLRTAEKLLSGLGEQGIKGQDRDFTDLIDVTRAALIGHKKSFGFILEQTWNKL
ncbi:hypothetical protein LRO45_000783 [Listeria monocytogenes]|uniref:hypothetical protein n=1 Tax=Listeria monocytogenes TaxID=1639 RepID=UPI0008756E47|nr:hypothetical protein [Listeria monocytogenes]ARJ91958.1 hypothetical protein ABY78_04820 [Listeria monocytogenes]EAD8868867.1 hypothetical protein [Listeria monocytogenes]EAG2369320.1 hypothetical protein [Listeria monocytogenes]EHB5185889.1 hypothetical protein [Listeria monocytogenes]EHN0470578.1 hypothetical protein [Listeria monocytogenes]